MRPNAKSNPQWLANVLASKAGACAKNRERVIALASAGVSLAKMAKQIGTNRASILRFLRREGVPWAKHTGVSGVNHPNWKGGRQYDKNGYVLVVVPGHPNTRKNRRMFEHRLVMAKMLGRPLLPWEVVHHKNGKHDDNRPENLVLFQKNSDHLRHELKGRVPKWTEDGLKRIQQGIARSLETRRLKTLRLRQAPGEMPSPETSPQCPG